MTALAPDLEMAERMCIVSREVLDEVALIRFVRSPQGEAVPDVDRRLPGRGLWVRLSRKAVAEAEAKKLFSRGFKAETHAAGDLAQSVGVLLSARAEGYLSLAQKAGLVVSGNAKVEALLAAGGARLLIHAAEAAPDGMRKLDRLVGGAVESIKSFTGAQLDLALGRSNVVHAAVKPGGLAEKLLQAARRTELYAAG